MAHRIFTLSPGSTSTKLAVFDGTEQVFKANVQHDPAVLKTFARVSEQKPYRVDTILRLLKENNIDIASMDAFAAYSGGLVSTPGGIFPVNDKILEDCSSGRLMEHPAILGAQIIGDFAEKTGKPAFLVNPPDVDEFDDVARVCGIKGIYRVSHSHVLNQKAVAEFHARKMGKAYEDCNFIVAHIDGGITVSAHDHGRMVDGNMGADGEGAFTPTRIGSLPVLQLLDYLEEHSLQEVRLACARSGGFVQYFGTSNSDDIHRLVEQGDKKACLVWNTMIYQICKMIGEMSTVLCGKVDGILLTGGLLRFDDIRETIEKRCGFIAPISVYPGEMEQEALALPTLKALRGELVPHKYTGKNVWNGFEGTDLV